jgi:hypothetical protein
MLAFEEASLPEKLVLTGPFTFTSPTVYLAHHAITGLKMKFSSEGEEEEVSTTRPPGIIPIPASEVYSMRPKLGSFNGSGLDYAHLVAQGNFDPDLEFKGEYETKQFDFGNLQDPVPASLYYDGRNEDCWGKQSHCRIITDDTYQPRLVFKNRVWASFLPDAFECQRPEFVDPPIALQPAYQLKGPVITAVASEARHPVPISTIIAQPGSQVQGSLIDPTAAAGDGSAAGRVPAVGQEGHKEITVEGGIDRSRGNGDGTGEHDPSPFSNAPHGGMPVKRPSDLNNAVDPQSSLHSVKTSPVRTISSVTVGSHTISVAYSEGSLVAAYMGTSTLHIGDSATVGGKVVNIGKNDVRVDGTVPRSSDATMLQVSMVCTIGLLLVALAL